MLCKIYLLCILLDGLAIFFCILDGDLELQSYEGSLVTDLKIKCTFYLTIFPVRMCSVERTTLQLIHKEIVHKKITDLILYIHT